MTNEEQRICDLAAGIAIGFLIGQLWAPPSGEEIRGKVLRRTSDGLEYLEHRAENLRERAGALLTRVKEWIGARS